MNIGIQKFLVNHNYRFIYIYIPKVACTSIKKWFIHTVNRIAEFGYDDVLDARIREWSQNRMWEKGMNVHQFIGSQNDLMCSRDFVKQSDYFVFAFVRNPFGRLVSVYIDKIVMDWREGKLSAFLNHFYQHKNTEASFAEFMYYISQGNEWADEHWRQQFNFLSGIDVDFVGRFENIESDFAILQKIIKTDYVLPKLNNTQYSEFSGIDYSAVPASDIRKLETKPHYKDFYTPELINIVKEVYKEDLDRFDYSWN